MEDENYVYSKEIGYQFETKDENKIDEMRQRVKKLREKRAADHKKSVDEKLDKAFQEQCEQMRTLKSKRQTQEIVKDWDEQLRMKARLECEAEDEERMWAYLWNKDAEEKWKHEEAVHSKKTAMAKQGLDELRQQMEYKKSKQVNITKIRAKEAAVNEAMRIQLEEEKRKQEEERVIRMAKSKAQAEEMLATRNYYRDRKIKREELVAQEFLKKAVRELFIEQDDRGKKKKEMMRAIQIYLDYTKKWDCLYNSRDSELQSTIDKVIEEQYLKANTNRWKKQQQRNRLQKDIDESRQFQLENLKLSRKKEETDKQEELAQLKKDWKEYMDEINQRKVFKTQNNLQYRRDLDSQVKYQQQLKEREKAEIKREYEMGEIEDGLFLNRLNKTLEGVKLESSNPYRDLLVGKPIKQCLRPI